MFKKPKAIAKLNIFILDELTKRGISFLDIQIICENGEIFAKRSGKTGKLIIHFFEPGFYTIQEKRKDEFFYCAFTPIYLHVYANGLIVCENHTINKIIIQKKHKLSFFSLKMMVVDKDSLTPLTSITFHLFNDRYIAKHTSDEKGKITFQYLLPGKYILKETTTLENYQIDLHEYEVDVLKDGKINIEKLSDRFYLFKKTKLT